MTGQHAGGGTGDTVHRESDCERGLADGWALPQKRPIELVARAVKFSIITVVLNNREGFERTARSIVVQRDAAFEWIVIDGGSTDGTLDVINAYSGFISYWQSRKDSGLYYAMNEGLARASADYVLMLNSGDCFSSDDSLNIVTRSVAQLARMPAMILAGASYEYPHGHRMIQKPRRVEDYIHHSNPASHQATFFSRRLHQQIPYDTRYRVAGDYDCICRVFLRDQSCSYINSVLIVALHGGSSFSHVHHWIHARECIRIQRKVLRMGYGSILRSSIRRLMVYIAEYLMSRRRLAPVTWLIIRAVRPTVD
jgi:putative colanic acid biosynthesis glycosyltransferase